VWLWRGRICKKRTIFVVLFYFVFVSNSCIVWFRILSVQQCAALSPFVLL